MPVTPSHRGTLPQTAHAGHAFPRDLEPARLSHRTPSLPCDLGRTTGGMLPAPRLFEARSYKARGPLPCAHARVAKHPRRRQGRGYAGDTPLPGRGLLVCPAQHVTCARRDHHQQQQLAAAQAAACPRLLAASRHGACYVLAAALVALWYSTDPAPAPTMTTPISTGQTHGLVMLLALMSNTPLTHSTVPCFSDMPDPGFSW